MSIGARPIVVAVTAVFVLLLVWLAWYRFRYSMDLAESFEVNTPDLDRRILIATQGSEYKNAVVAGVVEQLESPPTYIKVIDVSDLPSVDEAEWTAILVMHTWESAGPPTDAKVFLERSTELDKVVVLSTSGDGDRTMEGIDAIASASQIDEVSGHVSELVSRFDSIMVKSPSVAPAHP